MKKRTVSVQAVPQPATARNEIVVYQPDETIRLDVRLENETVWLTQARLGVLFNVDRTVINRHIHNIYKMGNSTNRQLVQKLHRFRTKVVALSNESFLSTISTLSLRSGIVSIQCKPRDFVSGRQMFFVSIFCAAMRSTSA